MSTHTDIGRTQAARLLSWPHSNRNYCPVAERRLQQGRAEKQLCPIHLIKMSRVSDSHLNSKNPSQSGVTPAVVLTDAGASPALPGLNSSQAALWWAGVGVPQPSRTSLAQLCHPQHPKCWQLFQCRSEHASTFEACTGVDWHLPVAARKCRREAKLTTAPYFRDAGPCSPSVAATVPPTGSCHPKCLASHFCHSIHSLWGMFILKGYSTAPWGKELLSPSYRGKSDSYGSLKKQRQAESPPTQHTRSKISSKQSHRTRKQHEQPPMAGCHQCRALPWTQTWRTSR